VILTFNQAFGKAQIEIERASRVAVVTITVFETGGQRPPQRVTFTLTPADAKTTATALTETVKACLK
jgi:hypothetical protein